MKIDTEFIQTEIGMVPEGWQVRPVEDCIESIIDYRGKTPRKSSSGVPLITAKIVKGGHIDYSNCEYIHDEDYDSWMRRGLPKEGDVVLTTEGPLGEVAQLDGRKVALAQRILTLRGKKGVLENNYLKYFLISRIGQEELHSRATGTTVQGIKQKEFRKIRLLVPPMVEQRVIAKILSDLDSKIESNQRMNKTLETIGKAIYEHWFIDFEFPTHKGKPYKSSDGEMVDDEELGKAIPIGWKTMRNISELCDKINYGYTQSASEEKVGPKFLRVMDINKGDWIDWNNVPYCQIEEKDREKFLLERGDIVIARMADPGKVAIFEHGIPAVFASYLIRIRLKDPKLAYYLYYLMKSQYYQDFILGAASGSVQSNLNAKGLTNGLPILLPPNQIIEKFSLILKTLRSKINENVAENEKLSSIRDLLLPKLMSGRIRVPDGVK